MELRQLRYFAKVAELLSFSRAAKALNITQSTLSQQVRQLEDELGSALLVRDSHHVALTDIGQVFLPSALRTLAEADASVERIRDVMELMSGELNIGCTYSFFPLLQRTVHQFMLKHPRIRLVIRCHSMEELMELLRAGRIDIALSYAPGDKYDDIEHHALFSVPLCFVSGTMHPLAGRERVTVADVVRYPLAMPPEGAQARNLFESLRGDLPLDVRLECNDINFLLDMVADGRLATILSRSTVDPARELRLVPIADTEGSMQGAVHYLKGQYRKRATKELLAMLCK